MLNKKTFSDGALIRFGWAKMQEHMGFFILMFLVMFGAVMGLGIVAGITGMFIPSDYWYFMLIFFLIYIALGTIMGIGMTKIMLDAADGKKPSLATLFTEWSVFFKFLAVTILYGLVVYAGLLLFVFPGIIWAMQFFLAPFFVVDKGMGPIEAMKKSSEVTMGLKWDIFAFTSVMKVVNTIGMFVFFVGLVFSVPTTMISMAKMYREIS